MTLPAFITDAFGQAHPGWHPVLEKGIHALVAEDPHYLGGLENAPFLPTQNRLFAAYLKLFRDACPHRRGRLP